MFVRDKPILSSERVLHKDYDCKGSVAKKKQRLVVSLKRLGAIDELLGGEPPVVK
jgi:hypothetical protein